jgi:hypothetical protein
MTCVCGHKHDEHDTRGDCTIYDDVTGEWCPCYTYEEDKWHRPT